MKPNNEKPSDGMQYFTPELYLRFNSSDDAIADQAQLDWENATTAYQIRLDSFRDALPPAVRQLSELNLHDANLLKHEIASEGGRPSQAFLLLQQQKQITALLYLLSDAPGQTPARLDWPFSPRPLHWLYDEIDFQQGVFIQRILLSDGQVLTIPFVGLFLHTGELPQPLSYRQTA
jgi:hypothetical protein